MVRTFALGVMIVILALPAMAWAEISMRTSEKENYSRLVFQGDEARNLEVKKEDGNLTLSFKSNFQIDVDQLKALSAYNIQSAEKNSNGSIVLTLKPGTSIRELALGSRKIIDVYDNPSQKRPANASAQTVIADDTQAPEQNQESSPVEQETSATKPAISDQQMAAMRREITAPDHKKDENIRPSLITLSSTQSTGLAVFESAGRLLMVSDKQDIILSPQVSGPNVNHFVPIEENRIQDGILFETKAMPKAYMRTQGGGLLWRIIVGGRKPKEKPIEFQRVNVSSKETRGGKILWPADELRSIINVKDPATGVMLKVITADNATQFAGAARSFVDFDVLPSVSGLAIRPKVSDLQVEITDEGVEISRPGGLALISQAEIDLAHKQKEQRSKIAQVKTGGLYIYDFGNWHMPTMAALDENRMAILSRLNDQLEGEWNENVISLAKMYLSNAMGPEALGLLAFVEDEVPDIQTNPEFLALRGAANVAAYKYEEAFADLSNPDLQEYTDVQYFRAVALAELGDWAQAADVIPDDFASLKTYPDSLRNMLSLVLAEILLRNGSIAPAEMLLGLLSDEDKLPGYQRAALQYLQGEAIRQKGDLEETITYWEPLTEGHDELYRVKAGLALTHLLSEMEKITPDQAIDNLERLRYAWRGDLLEAQVNYWLGKAYFAAGQYAKGLNIMREAATYAEGTGFAQRIAAEMSEDFTNFFIGERISQESALDAAALYDQFSELSPVGPQGDKVRERLAERLVRADLLEQAADHFEYQLEHRLEGDEAYRVAIRLAAIRLLDDKPKGALGALDKATAILDQKEKGAPAEASKELVLLRARALSQDKRPDEAIALLEDMPRDPDVHRLKADIAWHAGYWDDAAFALQDVILDEKISLSRPLSSKHATLILHRAVALNLAGDRIALADMREKYGDAMSKADKGKIFEVITRPHKSATLANRQALTNMISEVDLFSDFLNSYKETAQTTSN